MLYTMWNGLMVLMKIWYAFELLTYTFSNRDVGSHNVFWIDKDYISHIKVVSWHIHTTKLLSTWILMKNESRCYESNSVFPDTRMLYNCNFLECIWTLTLKIRNLKYANYILNLFMNQHIIGTVNSALYGLSFQYSTFHKTVI